MIVGILTEEALSTEFGTIEMVHRSIRMHSYSAGNTLVVSSASLGLTQGLVQVQWFGQLRILEEMQILRQRTAVSIPWKLSFGESTSWSVVQASDCP